MAYEMRTMRRGKCKILVISSFGTKFEEHRSTDQPEIGHEGRASALDDTEKSWCT